MNTQKSTYVSAAHDCPLGTPKMGRFNNGWGVRDRRRVFEERGKARHGKSNPATPLQREIQTTEM